MESNHRHQDYRSKPLPPGHKGYPSLEGLGVGVFIPDRLVRSVQISLESYKVRTDVMLIGLEFKAVEREPSLNIGIILECFQEIGNVPSRRDF